MTTEPMTKYTFVLKSGKWWTLTRKGYDEFVEVFSKVDVEAELKQMVLWCKQNKRKRKTPKGMDRFIAGWLSRSEEVGFVTERPELRCYVCKKVGPTSMGIVDGKTCKVRLCAICRK